MKLQIALPALVTLLLLSVSGCSKQEEQTVANDKPEAATTKAPDALPQGHPQVANIKAANISQGSLLGGIVEEVLQGGGYTYVKITIEGKEHWAAAPSTSVKIGNKVAWETNAPMNNFHSSTLNRTFETVYFVGQLNQPGLMPDHVVGAQAAAPKNMGVAAEVFDSAGYTYIKVIKSDQEVWLAVPQTQIEQGVNVVWNDGAEMRNFTSKSLNRTFESILFVDKVSQVN